MSRDKVALPDQLSRFLSSETICCLAVPLPDGGVHTTPLLYWMDVTTLNVYMATAKEFEKMWWYRNDESNSKASIVIGLAKKLPYLLQMRGTLEVFDYMSDSYNASQYLKISSSLDNQRHSKNTMVVFKPNWAKYNSWKEHTTHTLSL